MAASIPAPTPFLANCGSPTVPWSRWIKAFEFYYEAAQFKEPEGKEEAKPLKKSLLLHLLGFEGQRVARARQAIKENDTFAATKAELEKIFGEKPNVMVARYRFRQRQQLPGEDVKTFVAALRELTELCNYGAIQDDLIRDQLAEKTSNPRIRERLLTEKVEDLNLAKALSIAVSIEEASKEAKAMAPSTSSTAAVQSIRQPRGQKVAAKGRHRPAPAGRTAKPGGACTRCGRDHGPTTPCPAKGKTCEACGKKNHFRSCCRSQQAAVNAADEVITVYAVPGGDREVRATLELGPDRTAVSLMVDCGARVSLLSRQTADRISGAVTSPTTTKLRAYGGLPIQLSGVTELEVRYGEKAMQHRFFVAPGGDNIVGRDLMEKLGFRVDLSGQPPGIAEVSDLTADLQARYPTTFSGAIGCCTGAVHQPKVDPAVRPVQQPLRRLPLMRQEQVGAELDKMEKDGIIERVNASEWVSNLVVTAKKDGSIRICVDVREPNKALIVDKHPMPQLDEIASKIKKGRGRVFSKIDLKSGYMQMQLHESSRNLTAFITHKGLFRYRRVPFGLASAPAAFQRMLDDQAADLDGVEHILDDFIVYGRSEEEHDRRLEKLLQRLEDKGMTVNKQKCAFKQKEVEFFGFVISEAGIRPTESATAAIRDIRQPGDQKALKSFLGAANFLMRFVPHYADITEPLRRLLKADSNFDWTPECQRAFEAVKDAISKAPTLAHFDPKADTIVTTDASAKAIGAQLSQIQDGVERPVAFAARALTTTEQRYAANEREALASLWAMEKWHFYLYGRHFELRTDHQALQQLLLGPTGTGHRPLRIHRWCDRLLQYDFHVRYLPGNSNYVADLLSRWSSGSELNLIHLPDTPGPRVKAVTLEALTAGTAADETLRTAIRSVISGRWPADIDDVELRALWKVREQLSVWNN
ncbi:hypothetical protein BOX15_Mlig012942g1, partial [Macrostomum lignano]